MVQKTNVDYVDFHQIVCVAVAGISNFMQKYTISGNSWLIKLV